MKKKYLIHFILIFLLFIIFLKSWIVSITYSTDIGELWQVVFARHIMRYGVLKYMLNIPFLLAKQQGPMTAYFLILSMYLFGQNLFALKIPRIIAYVMTAVLTYLFARDFYNKKIAMLTTLAFVLLPVFITSNQEHTLMPLFLILSLYVFNRFCKTKKMWYFYLFAFVCGLGLLVRLSFLFYLSSLIITHRIVFKTTNNTIKKRHLIIALLLFSLGSYPFILFNLGGTTNTHYVKYNFNGVEPKDQFLKTVKFAFNNFPKTSEGVNLLDVGKNLKIGLTENLPAVLTGNKYYIDQPSSFFLPVFVFSLILISISISYKWAKTKFELVNKDLFLLLNFTIISFFISTITITVFRVEEFTMLFPLCALMVGRVMYEVLKISNRHSKSLFLVFAFFTIYLLIFSTYNFFKLFPQYQKNDIRTDCVTIAEEVVDFIIKANQTSVFVSDHGSIMNFEWHMYKRGVHISNFHIFFRYDKLLVGEDSLYVLAGDVCLDNKDDTIEKFILITNEYNLKSFPEDSFYLESGDLAYAIYRLRDAT